MIEPRLKLSLLGERDTGFVHLINRLDRLNDRIACYHALKSVNGIISAAQKRGAPCIKEATCERSFAERYEREAEAFFARRHGHALPKPKFKVTLIIDYGYGIEEAIEYDFRTYDDEAALSAFCSLVSQRGVFLYRRRFLK
ncbi:MAG: hypothetical protein IKD43_01340 [Clostridia bacterium]|nr:hypothetical protein [Clostridia bacterium]